MAEKPVASAPLPAPLTDEEKEQIRSLQQALAKTYPTYKNLKPTGHLDNDTLGALVATTTGENGTESPLKGPIAEIKKTNDPKQRLDLLNKALADPKLEMKNGIVGLTEALNNAPPEEPGADPKKQDKKGAKAAEPGDAELTALQEPIVQDLPRYKSDGKIGRETIKAMRARLDKLPEALGGLKVLLDGALGKMKTVKDSWKENNQILKDSLAEIGWSAADVAKVFKELPPKLVADAKAGGSKKHHAKPAKPHKAAAPSQEA
ncbi:MAG TPA: hypothetical protein VHB73_01640 [Alphaproteobacteria bacterium]|nr:hypothetical protein [Alphaproteobacteria bacterium]